MDTGPARFEARAGLRRVLGLWLLVGVCGLMSGLLLAGGVLGGKLDVIGYLLCLEGLSCSAYLAWYAVRLRPFRGPTLRMDDHGLAYAPLGEVAWPEVVGMALVADQVKGRAVRSLVVGVKEPGSVRQSGPARWLSPVHREMRIPVTDLDREPERMLSMARELRDRVAPPRLQAWFPGMVPVEIEAGYRRQALQSRMAAASGTGAADIQRRQAIQRELDAPVPRQRELDAARDSRRHQLPWLRRAIVVLALLSVLFEFLALIF